MLSSGDFLSEGLNLRPYAFDSINVDRIATWDEVNSLLSSGLIDYPRIRIAAAGNDYSRGYNGFLRYSISERGERRPRVVPGVLRKVLSDGCAIIIDNCEAFFPGVSALTEEISDSFCCRTWANLYVSPKGPGGFGCHFDDHDVFAIQIHGVKRWVVYAPTYHSPNRGDKSFHFPLPKGEPLKEYTLSTGDGLYLPFGYWHDVEAISDISMHVTIGLDFVRRADVLKLFIDELAKSRFFRDKVNYSTTTAEARELKERIVDAIGELDMEMLLDELRGQWRERKAEFNFPTL
ncbi:JmjC domain-containing protein [Burkholderia pyrrocinia]|uniref:JmjC domain-containing protein n=1 Tax=Burkholderia pyrrocinia TaxID=60550 RepID=UPI001BCD9BB8|nr:cupin domain-containing protein [Burkholderia pyrrocinia]QVN20485.1 hypothetical protein JYG32_28365 [Burkholderia pyrrocinia]